jgi:excisionase family DNA binding protein
MEDKIIDAREAARRLGVKHARLCMLIRSGELPAQKFAAVWMIREADVEALKLKRVGLRRGSKPSDNPSPAALYKRERRAILKGKK